MASAEQQFAARRIAFAAFMDRGAKFELQAFYWARSLIESGTAASPGDIHLYVPASLEEPPGWALRAGIGVVPIAYWDRRHPYCNKLGLWREELFDGYTDVCFTDTDIFFVQRPQLPLTDGIAAAIVDRENPKWPWLRKVFAAAGLPVPEPVPVRWSDDPGEVSAPTNCNGGFYLANRALIGSLGSAWSRWARWLLDAPSIASPLGVHVDQVALCLALSELGRAVTPLPATVNIPTHLGRLPGTFSDLPTVLHYHSHFDNKGNLRATGTAAVDAAIAAANRMIEGWKRSEFDNRLFWNARYALFPDLGSGIGSRGETLEDKRTLLCPFAHAFRSTIDIGCGDLEVTRGLPFQNYLGVDVSDEALAIAREKEPGRAFVTMGEFMSGSQSADLLLCLDVLIHQSDYRDFLSLIDLAVDRARDLVIISGYDAEPEFVSSMVFYHEPISHSLKTHAGVRRADVIGRYRDIVVYAAVKKHGRLDEAAMQQRRSSGKRATSSPAGSQSAHIGSPVPRRSQSKIMLTSRFIDQ